MAVAAIAAVRIEVSKDAISDGAYSHSVHWTATIETLDAGGNTLSTDKDVVLSAEIASQVQDACVEAINEVLAASGATYDWRRSDAPDIEDDIYGATIQVWPS